jgi:hypothetical protein
MSIDHRDALKKMNQVKSGNFPEFPTPSLVPEHQKKSNFQVLSKTKIDYSYNMKYTFILKVSMKVLEDMGSSRKVIILSTRV